jgi:hypothetical protein
MKCPLPIGTKLITHVPQAAHNGGDEPVEAPAGSIGEIYSFRMSQCYNFYIYGVSFPNEVDIFLYENEIGNGHVEIFEGEPLNLYLYDEKHENVFADLSLGPISKDTEEAIEKVIEFLDTKEITTRYSQLRLAKSYSKTFDKETSEYVVSFE